MIYRSYLVNGLLTLLVFRSFHSADDPLLQLLGLRCVLIDHFMFKDLSYSQAASVFIKDIKNTSLESSI